MHALVTGASGFLGGNLCSALVDAGHTVTAIRRESSQITHLAHLDLNWIAADVTDWRRIARSAGPAAWIFHCAADASMMHRVTKRQWVANVTLTQMVIHLAAETGARLIHVSSTNAIGLSPDGNPIGEATPFNHNALGMANSYATTKRAAQEAVVAASRKHGLDAVVACPAYMIGPLDWPPNSSRLLTLYGSGRNPLRFPGSCTFLDVGDACAGLIALAESPLRGELVILGGEVWTYAALADEVARQSSRPPPSLPLSKGLATVLGWLGDRMERVTGRPALVNTPLLRYARSDGQRYSSAKAKRILDYSAETPIPVAISRALKFYRNHGQSPR